MPLGSGFGASGAGALGCAYALNHHFSLCLTAGKAASIAHAAEVANGTGLGDVIAQNTGGLVIRIKPGAPGIGQVDRIPVPPTRVDCVVRGPISTKEVLSDPSAMRAVNQAGEACVKEIISRPTLEEFMRLSKRFTKQCNLASPWVLDVVEAVEAAGGQAAMIMLGEAVFALDGGQALREFGSVISASITQQGARLD
jgi:pantoate kinase